MLVFLEKNVERITARKVYSHDTDVEKLWEIVGQIGGYSRKIPNRDYEGWGLRLSEFPVETVYQNSRGSLKKE